MSMVMDETEGASQGAKDVSESPSTPSAFVRFNLEQWVTWINRFLNDELCDPSITVGHQEP